MSDRTATTEAGRSLLEATRTWGRNAMMAESIALIEDEARAPLVAALTQTLAYFQQSAGVYFAKYGNNDDPTDVLMAALSREERP